MGESTDGSPWRWQEGLVVAAALALAGPASAQWRPIVKSCASQAAVAGCVTTANTDGAWNVAVSPDGRNAYAAAWNTGALLVFDRNANTGALALKSGADGCITQAATPACATGRALALADDIVISADGRNVYVSSWASSVAIFDRNTNNGVLTRTRSGGLHQERRVGDLYRRQRHGRVVRDAQRRSEEPLHRRLRLARGPGPRHCDGCADAEARSAGMLRQRGRLHEYHGNPLRTPVRAVE